MSSNVLDRRFSRSLGLHDGGLGDTSRLEAPAKTSMAVCLLDFDVRHVHAYHIRPLPWGCWMSDRQIYCTGEEGFLEHVKNSRLFEPSDLGLNLVES